MHFTSRLPILATLSLSLFALLSSARAAGLSSWPEWRGTTGQGVAPGATPPTTWGDQKNIRWKAKVAGLGFSTPIIWKDRVYLLTAVETAETPAGATTAAPAPAPSPTPAPAASGPGGGGGGDGKGRGGKRGPGGFGGGGRPTKVVEFTVVALDRATGKTVWSKVARREVPHEGRHATNSFASASPLTDGEHLYVSFGSRGLYCYDLQGNLKWEKDLGDMQTRNGFGEGSSPALAGNFLIVPWDQEVGSFIVALDKKTGAEVWRQARDERTSWATPLIVSVGGKQQAVLPATKRTRSYDVATGEVIWEASGLGTNVIPTPVTGHGMVYVMSGFQGFYIQAIKLTARGDVSAGPDIVWQQRKGTPYVASPVLSGDRIFVTKERESFLSCLNALTGEFHFVDQPLEGMRGAARRQRPPLRRRPRGPRARAEGRDELRGRRAQPTERPPRRLARRRGQGTLPPRPRISLLHRGGLSARRKRPALDIFCAGARRCSPVSLTWLAPTRRGQADRLRR
jgi:outer membrane protein assembly factor BamB